jgi:cellobiose-specific phosphotransferase system component IIB
MQEARPATAPMMSSTVIPALALAASLEELAEMLERRELALLLPQVRHHKAQVAHVLAPAACVS